MSSNREGIPFQVQHLIDSMLNPRDNVYVRGNYRARLVTIRDEINKAISKYDEDVFSEDQKQKSKRTSK